MINSVAVYMFHSIGTGQDIEEADPHYSFSLEKYKKFLSSVGPCESLASRLTFIESNSIDTKSISNRPILTFDDGHISNYLASSLLAEDYDSTADFFVNSNNVGSKNFIGWSKLREMDSWGMSIQSHSADHIYLSDLSYAEQKNQLETSKKTIEDNIGKPVSILAPPGGRYNDDTIKLCHELGYKHLSISRPGKWKGEYCSPRIPILRQSSIDSLVSCNDEYSFYLAKLISKYKITGFAKQVLGNDRYDLIRQKLLGTEV
jgi:peptidoglycan/xylan/chitin deacetylase (PgdA/CDA1 family)